METLIEAAQKSEYFKRNHMGKATCSLCNVCCNDESNFLNHINGKTHAFSLERFRQQKIRQEVQEAEEKRNLEASQRARQEENERALLRQGVNPGLAGTSTGLSVGIPPLIGVHGVPEYTFKTEHDPIRFVTKIWLDFFFRQAEPGTRPNHRWVSASEQKVEPYSSTDKDYYIYLLVACEGYTTVGLKFPTEAKRTSDEEISGKSSYAKTDVQSGELMPRYRKNWNELHRQYSLFFELFK